MTYIPPSPGKGPVYVAVQYSKQWSGVEVKDGNGMNLLRFPPKPGAKFTTYEHAQQIANEWNKQ
jgi:hypothetical protein